MVNWMCAEIRQNTSKILYVPNFPCKDCRVYFDTMVLAPSALFLAYNCREMDKHICFSYAEQ